MFDGPAFFRSCLAARSFVLLRLVNICKQLEFVCCVVIKRSRDVNALKSKQYPHVSCQPMLILWFYRPRKSFVFTFFSAKIL